MSCRIRFDVLCPYNIASTFTISLEFWYRRDFDASLVIKAMHYWIATEVVGREHT